MRVLFCHKKTAPAPILQEQEVSVGIRCKSDELCVDKAHHGRYRGFCAISSEWTRYSPRYAPQWSQTTV